ncbi:RecQ family ATP-dependent DNA helicase [Spirulina subsalsa]|uniref:RecQ family ATP-dependent DNA helicase n=1 Tax=Spirulina subsalsa TaxID=54311 RepID=UPI0003060745|nr:RecQ family ATP-dependent DNA helicase [Spirulina subsalsa]
MDIWQTLQTQLQKTWGYSDFRPLQRDIIDCLLTGQDALILLPTGGGKSLCFQLPALLQQGLTLVISPLVALMENQVQELRDRQLPAASYHSETPKWLKKRTLHQLERQTLRLLYLSPETLLSPALWERLIQPHIRINGLILDEAHCLVQWGETFRPAYRRLGTVRPALLNHKPPGTAIPIAAFTATANPQGKNTICQVLQLRQPRLFTQSPYRGNLSLQVQNVWTPRGRKQRMLKFVQQQGNSSGLVYVRSRQDSETLSQWFTAQGYPTLSYHGGYGAQERREIEQQWLGGKVPIVVCTSAFGMGINKPDVRWVVHFSPPLLLTEYLQEVGRGGRDGKMSYTLTLVSDRTGWLNPEDQQRDRFFHNNLRQQYRQAQQVMQKLPPEGDLTQLDGLKGGAMALSLLHSAKLLVWLDPFHFQVKPGNVQQALDRSYQQQQEYYQELRGYFRTSQCRWQFLMAAFGFQPDTAFRCGHCDNCLSAK